MLPTRPLVCVALLGLTLSLQAAFPLAPRGGGSAAPAQHAPWLSSAGGRLIAIWTEQQGTTSSVHAVAIAPTGQPGTPHLLQENASVLASAVASNGDGYLAITSSNRVLYAIRIHADGSPAGEPVQLREDGFAMAAAVTWADGHWVIVLGGWSRLLLATLDGNELSAWTLVARTSPPPEWSAFVRSVAIEFDGHDLVLAWSESHQPPCIITCPMDPTGMIVARRLRPDGTLLGVPVTIPHWYGTSVDLATSGSEFLLVGDGRDGVVATLLRVTDGGLEGQALPSPLRYPARAAVTWDGTAYALALRYDTALPRIALQRYGRDGQPVGPMSGRIVESAYERSPISIVALNVGHSAMAIEQENPVDGRRAILYLESDLNVLPPPPSPPQNLHTSISGGIFATSSWEPSSTGVIEGYVIEIWPWAGDENVLSEFEHYTDVLAPETTQYDEYAGRMIRVRAVGPGGVSEPVEDVIGRVRRSVRH